MHKHYNLSKHVFAYISSACSKLKECFTHTVEAVRWDPPVINHMYNKIFSSDTLCDMPPDIRAHS